MQSDRRNFRGHFVVDLHSSALVLLPFFCEFQEMFCRVLYFKYLISLSILLTGCAAIPKLPDDTSLTVADVIHSVRCVLSDAVDRHRSKYAWLDDWAASVTLELKVDEIGDGNGGASFVVPISNGIFTIGFLAGVKRQAILTETVESSFNFDELSCPEFGTGEKEPFLIAGGLGLETWIERVASGLAVARVKPTSLSHIANFIITKNASVTPGVDLIRVKGHRFGAKFTLAGTRVDAHKLTVTAVVRKDRAKKIARTKTPGVVDPATQQQLDFKNFINSNSRD